MIRELNGEPGETQGEAETDHLKLRWSASNAYFRPGQRLVLILEIEPKDGMHVYSPDVGGGYIPISWTLSETPGIESFEAEYPDAEHFFLEAIDETLPVYHRAFQILRDVRAEGRAEFGKDLIDKNRVSIEGVFRYQACDDVQCFFPMEIPMRWELELRPHDLTRVREELRRDHDRKP